MIIRVVTPPDPIVTPDMIAGVAAGDAMVAALIEANTAEIDGPTGILGRCLGPQVLEMTLDCWSYRPVKLLCPPIIEMVSIVYLDAEGVEQTLDDSLYGLSGELLWFKQSWTRPVLGRFPGSVKVRYRAGYDPNKGTGPVPANAKRAIILRTQYLRSVGSENLFLKTSEVEGVGRRDYVVSDQAGGVIDKSIENMLRGLMVPQL